MQEIIAKLTAKDDKYSCAIADKIISESQDSDVRRLSENIISDYLQTGNNRTVDLLKAVWNYDYEKWGKVGHRKGE